MKVGDKVLIKDSQGAEGVINRIFKQSCQIHGEPIQMVVVDIDKPGHHIKKRRYHFQISQVEVLL